jgi:hypothetical protein
VDFDEGANSLADAANSHCISPSEVSDPQKVTEAGEGATASPAEGCGNV